MAEYAELLERIDRLAARAESPDADAALLPEIEDVLAEGYMQALTGEAKSRRIKTRLDRLAEALDQPGAAIESRQLAVQRRTLDHRIATLRGRLDAVREQFIRLGDGHGAPR